MLAIRACSSGSSTTRSSSRWLPAPARQTPGRSWPHGSRTPQPALKGLEFDPIDPPDEVGELLQVQVLPVVLGIFLAVLALGAVGHALVTVGRRRATDIAILRSLGLTRRDCRLILTTQSTVLAVAGLAFGIPAGLTIGRLLWHVVADYTPVQYVPPLAMGVLLAVTPAAIVLAGLLAAWPAHRAAHLRVAQILRAE